MNTYYSLCIPPNQALLLLLLLLASGFHPVDTCAGRIAYICINIFRERDTYIYIDLLGAFLTGSLIINNHPQLPSPQALLLLLLLASGFIPLAHALGASHIYVYIYIYIYRYIYMYIYVYLWKYICIDTDLLGAFLAG